MLASWPPRPQPIIVSLLFLLTCLIEEEHRARRLEWREKSRFHSGSVASHMCAIVWLLSFFNTKLGTIIAVVLSHRDIVSFRCHNVCERTL